MTSKISNELLRVFGEKAVHLTRELVRTPSENPPGNELEAARLCARVLEELGLHVILDEFTPGRANVIAYAGNRDDVGLVFNGHLDCVPAGGHWERAPYEGEISDGLLWGRGSADMKSGCAAIMAAAGAAVQSGLVFRKGVCLVLVADEESTNLGARHMLSTLSLSADACVVCEPTKLELHLGNRGYTSYTITTTGKSCHAGQPQMGVNAIYRMARVISKLEDFSKTLARRVHPQLGKMSLSVGLIRGGTSLNMVPERCEIDVEIRVFPGTAAMDMQQELQELLGDEASVAIRSELLASFLDEDSALVRAAAESFKQVIGREQIVTCFPACSEASFFSSGYGIPTVLLGPGDIAHAHRPDEWVEIEQIVQAVGIYAGLIGHYCL